MDVDLRSTNK